MLVAQTTHNRNVGLVVNEPRTTTDGFSFPSPLPKPHWFPVHVGCGMWDKAGFIWYATNSYFGCSISAGLQASPCLRSSNTYLLYGSSPPSSRCAASFYPTLKKVEVYALVILIINESSLCCITILYDWFRSIRQVAPGIRSRYPVVMDHSHELLDNKTHIWQISEVIAYLAFIFVAYVSLFIGR
jgi:hypothetical protein